MVRDLEQKHVVIQVGRSRVAACLLISSIITFISILHASNSFAQGSFLWADRIGGTSSEYSYNSRVDDSGNVYFVGKFQGTVDFDPGVGSLNLTSAGGTDIFVSKLNANGGLVWAHAIGAAGTDECYGIAFDDSTNVYITGSFSGTVDFDPGVGTSNLTSSGLCDIFVCKLDSSGSFAWARAMGGASANEGGWGIAVDGSGSVYISGDFGGTADFDPGAGTYNLTSAGTQDIFVSKLDSSGNFVWAKRMGAASNDMARGLVLDGSNNVYTVGWFWNTVDFDPGAGTQNLTAAGLNDTFVCKLDSSGGFVWAKAVGGVGNDGSEYVALDSGGNVYVTGDFGSTADFDPGAGTYNLTSAGGQDAFVLKLDSSGSFVWAKRVGAANNDRCKAVTLDSSNNLYTVGGFWNTVDFDPGAGTYNLTAVGLNDAYVLKLDSSGGFVWAKAVGGGGNDGLWGVALDSTGNVYASGDFGGTADFDPGAGTYNLTSAGGQDVCVLKLLDDTTPPAVQSLTRADSSPTNASSVDFTVVFSESVTGVDTTDFAVDATGVSGASVTGVSGSGDTYTVSVNTGSGNGTLSIDVSDDDSIQDAASNALGGAGASNGDYTAGESYAIDKIAPIVTIGAPSVTDTDTGPVTYTITYTGADSVTLANGDVSLNTTGTATGAVNVTGSGTATRTVTISSISGDGTLGILIGALTASDLAGNTAGTAGPSTTFNVDNTAPIVAIGAPSVADTNTGPATYTITYTGADSVTLANGDVSLNTTGTATGAVNVTGSGTATRTVTISSISGDGTLGISIGALTASDLAGNTAGTAGPSATFNVDNTAPGVSISASSLTNTNTGPVTYTITYTGADSVTLANGDVSLNTTGTATGSVNVTGSATATRTVTISGISGDGTLGISIGTLTASDLAGNTAGAAGPSATVNVDNTAPSVTVNNLTTDDDTPELTGTIDDATASLSVTVDGQTNPATNNGDGTWTLADNILTSLADGVYDVSATGTDAVGNAGSDGTTNELVVTEGEELPTMGLLGVVLLTLALVGLGIAGRASRKSDI